MGRLLAILSMLGVGCAQIAGIDNTNGSGRAVDSLTLTRMSIGATVETAPLDLTGLKASFLVDNGAGFDRVPAVNAGNGTWTSELRESVPVEFMLPDGQGPRTLALPAHARTVLYAVAEHPSPLPAPDGAMLSLLVQLPVDAPYVAGDRFQVLTLGAWSARTLGPGEIPQAAGAGATQLGPVTYAYASSVNPAVQFGIAARTTLDQLSARDAFLILRYAGAALIGVAEAPAFEQTGNDSLSATMTAVPRDRMLDVKLSPTTIAQRYSAVRPAVGGLSMGWALSAAPGYRLGVGLGPDLNGGAIGMAEAGVAAAYGNPFAARGWNTTFRLSTSESRTFTPAGAPGPVTLLAAMNQVIEPSASDKLDLDAGLPLLIYLGEKILSTDGTIVPPPAPGFVPVRFTTDTTTNTLYLLQVLDLVPTMAGTGLEPCVVFTGVSDEAEFAVPAELFALGHHYALRAIATRGGYPALDAGDLATRALPVSQSFVDSAVFTIMPVNP